MRTVFEVAPAGKYSRRLREPSPPPKKSLCSLLIAASPEKLLADSFTPSLTKAAGRTEEVRYGWVGGGGGEGGEVLRLNVETFTF